jgi:hypothetical protein
VSQPDLWVVEMHDNIAAALTEREGGVYVSPPQDREHALRLVALLVGHPQPANAEFDRLWRHAIAGGQRSVRLRRVCSGERQPSSYDADNS